MVFMTLKTLILVLHEVVEITYENKVIFGFMLLIQFFCMLSLYNVQISINVAKDSSFYTK